jgi:hypothetical protein
MAKKVLIVDEVRTRKAETPADGTWIEVWSRLMVPLLAAFFEAGGSLVIKGDHHNGRAIHRGPFETVLGDVTWLLDPDLDGAEE